MRALVPFILAVALTALAGCGQSEQTDGTAKPWQPSGQALTQSQVLAVHLGTPRQVAIARLGPPSATGPKTIAGDRCLYWRIVEQPPSALWRLCFRAGRLHIAATYLR